MTEHIQSTTDSPLINMLFHYGLTEGMPKIAQLIVNTAMLIERSQHLQADSYQRSPESMCYANGFKKKSLLTHPWVSLIFIFLKLEMHIPLK